jgi:hypothetical protein
LSRCLSVALLIPLPATYHINTGAEDFTVSPVSHEKVLCFLGGILGCDFESRPSVGLGIDVRLESIVTTGFALVHEGQFLHLSAFSSWKF